MKTKAIKASEITRQWHLVDANDVVLGRLASKVATILKGKHKPIYTPHLDTGDHVVIINADKVRLTGNKLEQKTYYRHTGYPGGLKSTTAAKMSQDTPEKVIRLAVKGMLPKNSLGRQMLSKLKIYTGAEHPHEAQIPQPLEICG